MDVWPGAPTNSLTTSNNALQASTCMHAHTYQHAHSGPPALSHLHRRKAGLAVAHAGQTHCSAGHGWYTDHQLSTQACPPCAPWHGHAHRRHRQQGMLMCRQVGKLPTQAYLPCAPRHGHAHCRHLQQGMFVGRVGSSYKGSDKDKCETATQPSAPSM